MYTKIYNIVNLQTNINSFKTNWGAHHNDNS